MKHALRLLLLCTLLFAASLALTHVAQAQEPPIPDSDEALFALVEQAGDADANAGADLVTVFKRTYVQVEPSIGPGTLNIVTESATFTRHIDFDLLPYKTHTKRTNTHATEINTNVTQNNTHTHT